MSTPENPESGQLTRRQIRQIRTASTPVVGSDTAVATQEPPPPPVPKVPLPRPAQPVAVAPAPGPDAAVDLGVAPLTRRQARQQERIRTASVPVITPEIAAAHAAPRFAPSAIVPEPEPVLWTPEVAEERESADAEAAVVEEAGPADLEQASEQSAPVIEQTGETEEVVDAAAIVETEHAQEQSETDAAVEAPAEELIEVPAGEHVEAEHEAPTEAEVVTDAEPGTDADTDRPEGDDAASREWLDPSDAGAEPETAAPRVDARFGDHLLAVDKPADVGDVSFDELLTRDSGGSGAVGTPHALILTHVPEASPLSAVTSTGEVIVTGIYNLPDGLGSQGHAHGTADGKEIDATLIDGELPAHSSPTPIAASAAISTVRGTGEIIRPPAPEKSNRWVMGLMITAGALALALVGLLVYVVATGVFN